MTERATVAQVIQLGAETTPGTAVAASKLVASFELTGGIKAENTAFRPAGRKYSSFVVPGREWSEWKIGGQATYGELPYLLSSILKTTTAASDGATAKLWTWAPALATEDTVKTYTVEMGSRVRAHRFDYALVSELGLNFSRTKGVEIDGTMLARRITDDIHLSTNATYTLTTGAAAITDGTFTLTYSGQTTAAIAYTANPAAVQAALEALSTVGAGNVLVTLTTAGPTLETATTVYTIEFVNDLGQKPLTVTGTFTSLTPSGGIALATGVVGVVPSAIEATPTPMVGNDLDFYVADSWAGLAGASAYARCLSASWKISSRFSPLWVIASANNSWAAHVETVPQVRLKVLVEADSEGMAFLTLMRNATGKWARFKCEGADIDTGKPYLFQLDGKYNVLNVSDFQDQDGVYATEWELEAVYDSSVAKTYEVQVRNLLAAL